MERIEIADANSEFSFDQAREVAREIAEKDNEFALLISWCDREKGKHSPCCLKCEIKGTPAWEVYGKNHEGRLRISVDKDRFVFIYS